MNLCGLIEDTGLRQRLTLLAADAGWSCWLDDDPAVALRVLDTAQPGADLVLTDQPEELAALAAAAGRAPVVLLSSESGAAPASALVIDPLLPDAELVLSLKTHVNARRFRERFAELHSHEPITSLPRHDELLQSLDSSSGNAMGLLVVQVDHAQHLYQPLDPVSRAELLYALSTRLQQLLPQRAQLGFYDPSCFVAALPELSVAAVEAAAQALVTHMREAIPFRGGSLHITVSVGFAFQAAFGDPERLWKEAWRAMRRVLTQHGDRATGNDHESLADRLPQALAREEFSLVLQPQFGLAGERMTGAEVLLRWQGMEVGELSPSHFIPVAESRGYMTRIGDWVLERACRAAATWFENRIQPVRLGINVSPQQFNRGAIVAQIERLRAERWLDPGLLELEVSHEAMLRLVEGHRDQLYRLRDLGVQFALDNLGSSLVDTQRLLRCPADTLKIDRTLIERIDRDPAALELVERICALAQRFELRAVAVGVERDAQLERLRRAGCTDVQGYLLSPPVTLEQFRGLLADAPTERRGRQAGS